MKGKGIVLGGSGNWIVKNVLIEQCRRTGLYLTTLGFDADEGLHGLFDTVMVFANGRDNVAGDLHGIVGYGVQGCMFRNCISLKNHGYGFVFQPYTDATYFRNLIELNSCVSEASDDGELIFTANGAIGYKDIRITSCYFLTTAGKSAIELYDCVNTTMTGNNASNGARFVQAVDCDTLSATGNTMSGQSTYPIYLNGGTKLTAFGNQDDGSAPHQVEIAGTPTNSTVLFNRVSSSGKSLEIVYIDGSGNNDAIRIAGGATMTIQRNSDSKLVVWA